MLGLGWGDLFITADKEQANFLIERGNYGVATENKGTGILWMFFDSAQLRDDNEDWVMQS